MERVERGGDGKEGRGRIAGHWRGRSGVGMQIKDVIAVSCLHAFAYLILRDTYSVMDWKYRLYVRSNA